MLGKIIVLALAVFGAMEIAYFTKEAFEDYVAREVSKAINKVMKDLEKDNWEIQKS